MKMHWNVFALSDTRLANPAVVRSKHVTHYFSYQSFIQLQHHIRLQVYSIDPYAHDIEGPTQVAGLISRSLYESHSSSGG